MHIIFDIGGTKIRIATTKNGKKIDKIKIVPTPQDYNEGVEVFINTIKELSDNNKIKSLAGGICGTINHEKKKLSILPNLPKWSNKSLQKKLEKSFRAPVVIENDAAVVGLGEAVFGAGKGKNIVAYITISTGVGGARIVGGKIDEVATGFEPGHQIIDWFNQQTEKANFKDWEGSISGKALEKHYHKKPSEIKDKKIWQEINKQIAIGLNNVLVFWSPDVVVLGGGMMNGEEIDIVQIKKDLKNIVKIYPKIPPIRRAKLKDVGGLYGAMCLLKK